MESRSEQVWLAVIYLSPGLSYQAVNSLRIDTSSPAIALRFISGSGHSQASASGGLSLILSKNGLHVNVQWPAPTPGWHRRGARGGATITFSWDSTIQSIEMMASFFLGTKSFPQRVDSECVWVLEAAHHSAVATVCLRYMGLKNYRQTISFSSLIVKIAAITTK